MKYSKIAAYKETADKRPHTVPMREMPLKKDKTITDIFDTVRNYDQPDLTEQFTAIFTEPVMFVRESPKYYQYLIGNITFQIYKEKAE